MVATSWANRRSAFVARRPEKLVAGIVVAAAVVRFSTLGAKSFWGDEGLTYTDLHGSFSHMWGRVGGAEDTPPLYFVVAWFWSRLFGLGEVGMRSLSALLGTMTVPVVYAAGRRLVGRRPAITAAALVAVNPLLVWYGQEARSYALLVFLGALSLLFSIDTMQTRRPWALLGWTVTSVLLLYTHYFGFALVVAEGVGLLWRSATRARTAVAVAVVVMSALPLLPTLLDHANGPQWVARTPFSTRLLGVPGAFLVGFEAPHLRLFAVVTGLLVVIALALLVRRGTPAERRGGLAAASLGGAVVLFPLTLLLLGRDLFLFRYVLLAMVPFAIVVAAGLGGQRAGRLGAATAAALCGVWLIILGLTAWNPKYGTQDWRAVAASIRTPNRPKAILVYPRVGYENDVLSAYLGRIHRVEDKAGVLVREVDIVSVAERPAGGLTFPSPAPPPLSRSLASEGFRLLSRRRHHSFALSRYRAERPQMVSSFALAPSGRFASSPAVLLSYP